MILQLLLKLVIPSPFWTLLLADNARFIQYVQAQTCTVLKVPKLKESFSQQTNVAASALSGSASSFTSHVQHAVASRSSSGGSTPTHSSSEAASSARAMDVLKKSAELRKSSTPLPTLSKERVLIIQGGKPQVISAATLMLDMFHQRLPKFVWDQPPYSSVRYPQCPPPSLPPSMSPSPSNFPYPIRSQPFSAPPAAIPSPGSTSPWKPQQRQFELGKFLSSNSPVDGWGCQHLSTGGGDLWTSDPSTSSNTFKDFCTTNVNANRNTSNSFNNTACCGGGINFRRSNSVHTAVSANNASGHTHSGAFPPLRSHSFSSCDSGSGNLCSTNSSVDNHRYHNRHLDPSNRQQQQQQQQQQQISTSGLRLPARSHSSVSWFDRTHMHGETIEMEKNSMPCRSPPHHGVDPFIKPPHPQTFFGGSDVQNEFFASSSSHSMTSVASAALPSISLTSPQGVCLIGENAIIEGTEMHGCNVVIGEDQNTRTSILHEENNNSNHPGRYNSSCCNSSTESYCGDNSKKIINSSSIVSCGDNVLLKKEGNIRNYTAESNDSVTTTTNLKFTNTFSPSPKIPTIITTTNSSVSTSPAAPLSPVSAFESSSIITCMNHMSSSATAAVACSSSSNSSSIPLAITCLFPGSSSSPEASRLSPFPTSAASPFSTASPFSSQFLPTLPSRVKSSSLSPDELWNDEFLQEDDDTNFLPAYLSLFPQDLMTSEDEEKDDERTTTMTTNNPSGSSKNINQNEIAHKINLSSSRDTLSAATVTSHSFPISQISPLLPSLVASSVSATAEAAAASSPSTLFSLFEALQKQVRSSQDEWNCPLSRFAVSDVENQTNGSNINGSSGVDSRSSTNDDCSGNSSASCSKASSCASGTSNSSGGDRHKKVDTNGIASISGSSVISSNTPNCCYGKDMKASAEKFDLVDVTSTMEALGVHSIDCQRLQSLWWSAQMENRSDLLNTSTAITLQLPEGSVNAILGRHCETLRLIEKKSNAVLFVDPRDQIVRRPDGQLVRRTVIKGSILGIMWAQTCIAEICSLVFAEPNIVNFPEVIKLRIEHLGSL